MDIRNNFYTAKNPRGVSGPLQDVYHILVRDSWVESTKQAVQIQPVSNLYHCSHVIVVTYHASPNVTSHGKEDKNSYTMK